MSLLIKNAENAKGVYVEAGRIVSVGKRERADEVLDARGKFVLPGMVNTHTHAAMVLLRGYGEGLPLKRWLEERIWPAEKKLTKKAVYWGTRLAIMEMLRSGTVAFNNMYFFPEEAAKAAEETGIRAAVSYAMIDNGDAGKREEEMRGAEKFLREVRQTELVTPMLAPHAPYTVSKELLRWSRETANEHKIGLHTHVSETEWEVKGMRKRTGKTPVQYLESLGFWGEDVIAAHGVWLTPKDREILKGRGVKVSHCPVSNMKLGSGTMDYGKMGGIAVSLGTDGAASNNSLDMFREMKTAALLHGLGAKEAWKMATVEGAKALGYKTGIRKGAAADLMLVDRDAIGMVPMHDLYANLVYGADGSAVSDVVVNGKVVMRNREINEEKRIIRCGRKWAGKIAG